MVDAICPALSALKALGKKLEVTANNIANMNTNGFKKSRVMFEEASPTGVTVSIIRINTPGSSLPGEERTDETKESSNVAIEEEAVDLVTTKHAYAANLKTIKTEEEILGTFLDILDE